MPKKGTKSEEAENEVMIHEILGNLVSLLQNNGFQPVILPPLEFQEALPGLAEQEQAADETGGARKENGTAPTQVFSAYRLYTKVYQRPGSEVVKWYYTSPVISLDAGEKAKLMHELGVFVFGKNSPMAFAQLINTASKLLQQIQKETVVCELNNIGCDSCIQEYQEVLESHFVSNPDGLCDDCTTHLSKSVREVLACSNGQCQERLLASPQVVDFLDEECRQQLVELLEMLDEMEIPYVLNPTLYTSPMHERVIFRIGRAEDESVLPLLVGGDYSTAFRQVDEEVKPAVGFVGYLEDLLADVVLDEDVSDKRADVFVISLGDQAAKKALRLYKQLSSAGIKVAESMVGNSGIKDQLKEAKKLDPSLALIVGQKEALDETVLLRDMKSSMQETFGVDRILDEVKKRLGE